MIEWLIEAIRGALTEAETGGAWGEAKLIAWIVGPFLTALGLSYATGRSRFRAAIREAEELRSTIETRNAEIKRQEEEVRDLKAQIRFLEGQTCSGFLDRLRVEERDNNFDKTVKLSEDYIAAHRPALNKAYRALAQDAVAYAALEGVAGYVNAQRFAFASWIAEPDDTEMLALSEELKQAEELVSTGARVRIRSDEERKAISREYDEIPEHLSAIEIAHGRAFEMGAYKSATILAQTAVRLAEKLGGVQSEHTLYWRYNHAQAIWLNGESQKALELAKALLSDRERVSGKDHPDTLSTRYLIASCLKGTGEPKLALQHAKALLPDIERVSGKDHPDTLLTRHLIASCLKDTGEPKLALQHAEALLPDRERVSGKDHPDTLLTRHLIASCLQDTGEPKLALQHAEALLPDIERVSGKDHPYTLATRSLIAACLRDTGEPKLALQHAEALLPDIERVSGKDHPHTLATRSLIASCLQDTGEPKLALQHAEALLPDRERVSGKDHPDTLATRYLIASCLTALDRLSEAKTATQGVIAGFAKVGYGRPIARKARRLAEELGIETGESD